MKPPLARGTLGETAPLPQLDSKGTLVPDQDDKQNPAPGWVSNSQLQLEIKALRSDVKLWIIGAVVLNQFLAGVALPSAVTGAAILGLGVKALFALVVRG